MDHPGLVSQCEGPKGRVTRGTMVDCCLCSSLKREEEKEAGSGSCARAREEIRD